MQRYILGLGSNRLHGRFGPPERVIAAAITTLRHAGITVLAQSRMLRSRPLGPSLRRYANCVALVETRLLPPALLAICKVIEADFGRRRGQRWGSRVIDIDLVLWSGGAWHSRSLTIPHKEWQHRSFVADGVAELARHWPVPQTSYRAHHAAARLKGSR